MRIQKPADLARLIKTRRQAQGLTQQAVAAAVGITRQSLARIERGHGGVSFDTVLRIFEHLGIQLTVGSRSQPPAASPVRPPILNNLRWEEVAASPLTPKIDTQAFSQNIDLAAIAKTLSNIDTQALTQNIDLAAIAKTLSNIDAQALTRTHIRNLDISPVAAAVKAASQSIDAATLLRNWQHTLSQLTTQLQESAARSGATLGERQARHAVLSAAIEAGDPDLKPSTDARGSRPATDVREISND